MEQLRGVVGRRRHLPVLLAHPVGAAEPAAEEDGGAVLGRDGDDLGLHAGGDPQPIADGLADEVDGRRVVVGARLVVVLVGDDPVLVRVGPRRDAGVSRTGVGGRVTVVGLGEARARPDLIPELIKALEEIQPCLGVGQQQAVKLIDFTRPLT
jgi:hypothetical protein